MLVSAKEHPWGPSRKPDSLSRPSAACMGTDSAPWNSGTHTWHFPQSDSHIPFCTKSWCHCLLPLRQFFPNSNLSTHQLPSAHMLTFHNGSQAHMSQQSYIKEKRDKALNISILSLLHKKYSDMSTPYKTTGGMAQRLKALTAHAENKNLNLSTHTGLFTTTITPVPMDLTPFSGLHRNPHTEHTHIYT